MKLFLSKQPSGKYQAARVDKDGVVCGFMEVYQNKNLHSKDWLSDEGAKQKVKSLETLYEGVNCGDAATLRHSASYRLASLDIVEVVTMIVTHQKENYVVIWR